MVVPVYVGKALEAVFYLRDCFKEYIHHKFRSNLSTAFTREVPSVLVVHHDGTDAGKYKWQILSSVLLDLLSITEMVQRKVKEVVVFNEKDQKISLDEFVKDQQSLIVFDCNTSTSIASNVLSLVALDNIDSLNSPSLILHGCTSDTVQVVSPLKNITNLEVQDYVRLFFNREPEALTNDSKTVEGIMTGIILVYFTQTWS